MRKKIYIVLMTLGLVLAITPIFAGQTKVPMHLQTPGIEKTLVLPLAADHSPVISLGTAIDPQSGEAVEGYAIIHYKDNSAKTSPSKGKGSLCYGYLASGAKWKTVEGWVMNPANSRGLDPLSVFNTEANDIIKWEDATDGIIGNNAGYNILGVGATTSGSLTADTASPDGINEVYFGSISDQNAIAVTIVWGIFSGPTFQRKLVEWDQVFDDAKFDWSLTGEAGKMDFENISTHELGHSVGMADLYNTCVDETMYGYASEGETKKRDLNAGDITGINQLY